MKKPVSILLCALLALYLTLAPTLAEPATDAFVFTFRDGITWDITLEEAMAAEGVPEGNEHTNGNMAQFKVNGVSFAGLTFDLMYLYLDSRLIVITLIPADGSGDASTLAALKATLTEQYGQPNLTELDRVFKVVAAVGGDVGDTVAIEVSPWAGWTLPDERTLIFTSYIDNSVGLLFLNEAPNAPAPTSAPRADPESAETAVTSDAPRGFATETECAKAVADALIAGDTQAFLDCHAISEMARAFDLAAYIEAYKTLSFNNLLMQPTSTLNVAYNEATLTQRLLRKFVGSCLLLNNENPDDDDFISGLLLLPNEHTPEEMLAAADTGDALAGLVCTGIMQPDVTQDNYLRSFTRSTERNKLIYGMTELTETVVLLEKDGRTFWLPLSLVRYDSGWLVAEFAPVFALMNGMPSYTLLIDADTLDK